MQLRRNMASVSNHLRDSFPYGHDTTTTQSVESTLKFASEDESLHFRHQNPAYWIHRPCAASDIAAVPNPTYEGIQTNESYGISLPINSIKGQDDIASRNTHNDASVSERSENEMPASQIQASANQAYGIIPSTRSTTKPAQTKIGEGLAPRPSPRPVDSTALRPQHSNNMRKNGAKTIATVAALSMLISGIYIYEFTHKTHTNFLFMNL